LYTDEKLYVREKCSLKRNPRKNPAEKSADKKCATQKKSQRLENCSLGFHRFVNLRIASPIINDKKLNPRRTYGALASSAVKKL
jgi:hypothetical protein